MNERAHQEHTHRERDWRVIDAELVRLAEKKGELEVELGRWLLAAESARVDRRLGFGSFFEYIERRLGYDRRTTKEKLRVARALEALPRAQEELRSGRRTWSALRELVRVLTPATEGAWLDRTERMTTRQVEAMVRGRRPGDLPSDEKDPLLTPHRMVFDLLPEAFAKVEEAFEKMREQIGPAATRAEALVALAEAILVGPAERQPAYQTSLTVCVACERTWQRGGGALVEVSPALGACAKCDGVVVGFTQVDEGISPLDGAPPTEAGLDESDRTGTRAPPNDVVRHDRLAEDRPAPTADEPLPVGAITHVSPDLPTPFEGPLGARALVRLASRLFGVPLRSMTPRLRALVKARDNHRCIVPGCTNFRFIELHHHHHRRAGGLNTAENLYSVCSAHHRALHEGLLAIEGSPSEGFVVRHRGGVLYGAPPKRGGSPTAVLAA